MQKMGMIRELSQQETSPFSKKRKPHKAHLFGSRIPCVVADLVP